MRGEVVMKRKIMTGIMILSMLVFSVPVNMGAVGNDSVKDTYPDAVYLNYSDTGVEADGKTTGCTITGTDVEINSDGTYVLGGSCANGSITVKKEVKATLVLNNLELTEPDEGSCPIWTKSGSVVSIVAYDGTVNVLTDALHDGAKPKACINVNGDLNLSGHGKLIVNGNNKNGIKADGNIVSESIELEINAVANGMAADNKLTINSGNYKITDGNDGIKSEPETTDNTEDGNIEINGGTFEIVSAEDGIQAESKITIKNGTFNITTNGGHTTSVASTDKNSYKGIKASEYITIYDGDITIDSADDAIHSNQYVYLIGGTYNISTGDDGAHADTSLIIGEEGGDNSRLTINVNDAYEGLEAGTVYIYSGNVNILASDDGINAAGGSDGTNNEWGGNGPGGFNPGGGGGRGPGGGAPGMPGGGTNPSESSTDYSINIYGGRVYVDVEGDGYDSNGNIVISGGTSIIWGAASNGRTADNSALDWGDFGCTCTISGGTVFAAGSRQMTEAPATEGSQNCITISGTTRNSGEAINIVDSSNNALFSTYAKKTINHVIYSSPSLTQNKGTLSDVTDKLLKEDGVQQSGSEGETPAASAEATTQPQGTETGTKEPEGAVATQVPATATSAVTGTSAVTPTPAPAASAGAAAQPQATASVSSGTSGNETLTESESSAVSEAQKKTIKGITYELKDGMVTVISARKNIKTAVIPATVKYDGRSYPVTNIASKAFAGCKKLTSVTIGANIKKIGNKAFYGCTKLNKIVFKGSKVPAVGKNAFKGINKTASISVNKKSKSAYKTVLTKKTTGCTKNMKIK